MAIARSTGGVVLLVALAVFGASDAWTQSTPSAPIDVADVLPTHDATTGTLAGQAATDGGAATYNVPIVVPPGRAGMQPSIALTYNSRGGDGVVGLGWSISGLSSIHRCPQTPEQDGFTKGVTYTTDPSGASNDRLCLDGQRLVPTAAGLYGASGMTYSTEINSFARITQVGGTLAGAVACFKVEEKSGRILHYGAVVSGTTCALTNTARAQPSGAPATLSWLLVKVEDRVGNNQLYTYDASAGNGEVLLSKIAYTGFGSAAGDRSVNFAYVDRASAVSPSTDPQASDKASSYLAGGLTMQTKALSSITTKLINSVARVITPTYMASTYSGRLQVTSLSECAYNGLVIPFCHPATQFTTINQQPGVPNDSPTFNLSSLSALNLPQTVAKPVLTADEQATATSQLAQRAAAAPLVDPSLGSVELAQSAGDFDGDGTREMAFQIAQSDGLHDYLVQLAADRQVRGAVDVTGKLCYNSDCYGDFAGDGRSESVIMPRTTSDPAFIRFGVWTLGRGAIPTPGSQPIQLLQSNVPAQPYFPESGSAAPLWAAPHVADIDGDGRLDLVTEEPTGCGSDMSAPGHPPKLGVFAHINDTQLDPATHTINPTYPPHFTVPGTLLFCLNHSWANNFPSVVEHIDHVADFDGDGLPDIFVTNAFTQLGNPSLTQVRLTKVQNVGGVRTVSSAGALSCTDIGLLDNATSTDDCRWTNGYAVRWMDVNGDGLDDFVIARPNQGQWFVRLNQGGHLGAEIATSGTGSHAGLDNYQNLGPGSNANAYFFKYANRVPVMDVDGDGKVDLLTVSSFALKMCAFYRLPPQPLGEGCPVTNDTFSPQCPAYACPQDPGTGAYTMPGPHQPDQIGRWNGNVVFPMYGSRYAVGTGVVNGYSTPDVGYGDTSAYNLSQIKFVQTGPAAIEARLLTTNLVSSLQTTSPQSSDVFGDGLTDLLSSVGCNTPPQTIVSTTYPGCLVVDQAGFGPATMQVYSSPTALTPTTVPTSSFAATDTMYVNQNIGDGLYSGQSSLMAPLFASSLRQPLDTASTFYSATLPDLLQSEVDGVGDYAAWGYSPLSLPINQASVPLYTIPSANGYNDTRHYYFTSSMPVVAGMVQNNGIGDQFGFRSNVYGYSEAMYNHLGRGFQGFRTITTLTGTNDTTRRIQATTIYNQKFPLTGKLASACSYVPPALPVTASALCNPATGPTEARAETDTWVCSITNRAACPQGDTLTVPTGATVYTPQLDKTHVQHFDLLTGAAQSHVDTVNAASATATASGWDAYGNLKNQVITSADDGAGGVFVNAQIVTASNSYAAADTTNWWLDKLNQNTTTTAIAYASAHPLPSGASAPLRSVIATFQWNPDRTPLSQGVQLGVPNQEHTTTYAYPSTTYGLPSSVTVSAPSAVPSSRKTSFTYTKGGATTDADGYFVLTTSNPLLQVTTTARSAYDGQVTTLTDPNNLQTVNTYDVFGRVTQTDYKDASGAALYPSRKFSLTKCTGGAVSTCGSDSFGEDGNQAYAAYRLSSIQTGNRTIAEWFDPLGRKTKHVDHGYNGDFIETLTDYDDMNTLAEQSTPFFVGSVPYFTAFTYDRLGRPIKKLAPGAELDPTHGDISTIYSYNGATTTIKVRGTNVSATCSGSTNLCMDMKRSYDVLGRLEQTVQNLGGTANYAATNYWYDGPGNPVAARDAENNLTRASYNDIGQRTDSYDPDAGHSLFAYDALGELLTQTDARGIATVHVYDALGRLLQRTATNAAASDTTLKVIQDAWSYDPIGANGGAGLLGSARRLKGATTSALAQVWKEDYSYEAATKLLSAQIGTLDGQANPWTTSYTYDNYGRELTETFPSGLVLKETRNLNGELSGYINNATGVLYWFIGTKDPWGNVLSENYPTLDYFGAYDVYASTGQYQRMRWATNTEITEELDYRYDSFGNLVQQTRGSGAPMLENFSFDSLQRLTRVDRVDGLGNPATVTYGYRPSGNLDYKSDYSFAGMGAYGYGVNGCGPHAAANVIRPDTTVTTFNCDASGNVIGGNTLTASYDFNNQPWSMQRGNTQHSGTFSYDANGKLFEETTVGYSNWSGPRGFERGIVHGQNFDRHDLGTLLVVRTSGGAGPVTETVYAQPKDRLGSPILLTEGMSYPKTVDYDAFGQFRERDYTYTSALTTDLFPYTLHAFTGHENVGYLSLLHMGGRTYDPALGRFLQVDPVIQFPTNTQSLNPYSYVLNNPLAGKDPSGYSIDNRSLCSTSPGSCGWIYGTDTASALKALGAGNPRSQPHDSMGTAGATSTPRTSNNDASSIGSPSTSRGTMLAQVADPPAEESIAEPARRQTVDEIEAEGRSGGRPEPITKDVQGGKAPLTLEEAVESIRKINPNYKLPNTIGRGGINNDPSEQRDQAYEDLRKEEANSIAILRGATSGKGNFGVGSASRDEAQRLGEAWVGENYEVSRDGNALISKDGLRQFRSPSAKPNSPYAPTGVQANFESRLQPRGQWQSNAHLDVNDP